MTKRIWFDTGFWESSFFKKIKEQGDMLLLVYCYLCTNSRYHPLGIYRITYTEIGSALSMNVGLAKTILDTLEKINVCRYDETNTMLWLCHHTELYLRDLKPRDKRRQGAITLLKHWKDLSFMQELEARYNCFLEKSSTPEVAAEKRSASKSTIELLFKVWQETMNHPRAKLDKRRYRCIEKALHSYTTQELMDAIRGCQLTPYNMGDNATGQRFDDITLILRDATHIERFMQHAVTPPQPRTPAYRLARRT